MPKNRKKKKTNRLQDLEKRAKAFFPRKRHELNADTCLIVDGTNIAYQAYHAYNLSYQGRSTSILFGFLQILGGILKNYKVQKVVICWDGGRDPIRMKALPTYKSHRDKTKDPRVQKRFNKEIRSTRVLLRSLGICQAYNPDLEGDDMIYWMWKRFSPMYRIIIATADKDMHQLINYDTTIYNPRTKQPFSNFAYICDHLVEPYQFVDYLCLLGDKSDDIPGYAGIGEVRAARFFAVFKGVKEYLQSDKEHPGLSDKESLEALWKRNRLMIDLRYFNEKYHNAKEATFYKNKINPLIDEAKLNSMCIKYGLKSYQRLSFLETYKKLQNA